MHWAKRGIVAVLLLGILPSCAFIIRTGPPLSPDSSGTESFGLRQMGLGTFPRAGQYDALFAESCQAVAHDADGNVFCGGSTRGSLAEKGGSPGNGGDAFVAKFSASGVLLWIRQLGAVTTPGSSSGDDNVQGVATDASGNVYIGGFTNSSLGEAHGGGNGDAYVAKLNSSGTLQWVRQLGVVSAPAGASSGDDECRSIAVDSASNVYCAGRTSGDLGEVNGGVGDAFIVKYNSSGALQWIRQLGSVSAPAGASSADDACNGITIDSADDIYCAGDTSGAIAEANGGNTDAFIVKYSSAGNQQWIRQVGDVTAPAGASAGTDSCQGLVVDSSDNIYCGGSTDRDLGETRGGGTDALIVKYNSAGNLQWIRQLGDVTAPSGASSGADVCLRIAVDTSNNVYCGGSTDGNLGEANGGASDGFIAKYNAGGNFQWVWQLGAVTAGSGASSLSETCSAVSTDSLGNVFCGGGTAGSLGETNAGSTDIFIAKVTTAGSLSQIVQLGRVTAAPGPASGFEYCLGTATDASGNVFCGGYTTGSLGEARGGLSDAFVAKYNSTGTLQWVRQLGAVSAPSGASSLEDLCYSITTDTSGNVYCGGYTTGNLGEVSGGGSTDAFIAKYNSMGELQWIRQLGAVSAPAGASSGEDFCYGVATDASGNVYCAGYTLGNLGEANGGDRDVFIAKYNSSGVLQWIRQLGSVSAPAGASSGTDYCNAITTDSDGNVYCTGTTTGSLGEATGGSADAFLVKYNSSGVLQWIRQLGSVSAPAGASLNSEESKGVASDSQGNIYFGGATSSSLAESNGGLDDAYIAKYNSSGVLQWIRQLGSVSAPGGASSTADLCTGIASDVSGNVYCGGYTSGNLGETSGGGSDAFIAKYDSSGVLQWVRQQGAISSSGDAAGGDDYCIGIATDLSGHVYCGGYTDGNLGETNAGANDAFIWSLDTD